MTVRYIYVAHDRGGALRYLLPALKSSDWKRVVSPAPVVRTPDVDFLAYPRPSHAGWGLRSARELVDDESHSRELGFIKRADAILFMADTAFGAVGAERLLEQLRACCCAVGRHPSTVPLVVQLMEIDGPEFEPLEVLRNRLRWPGAEFVEAQPEATLQALECTLGRVGSAALYEPPKVEPSPPLKDVVVTADVPWSELVHSAVDGDAGEALAVWLDAWRVRRAIDLGDLIAARFCDSRSAPPSHEEWMDLASSKAARDLPALLDTATRPWGDPKGRVSRQVERMTALAEFDADPRVTRAVRGWLPELLPTRAYEVSNAMIDAMVAHDDPLAIDVLDSLISDVAGEAVSPFNYRDPRLSDYAQSQRARLAARFDRGIPRKTEWRDHAPAQELATWRRTGQALRSIVVPESMEYENGALVAGTVRNHNRRALHEAHGHPAWRRVRRVHWGDDVVFVEPRIDAALLVDPAMESLRCVTGLSGTTLRQLIDAAAETKRPLRLTTIGLHEAWREDLEELFCGEQVLPELCELRLAVNHSPEALCWLRATNVGRRLERVVMPAKLTTIARELQQWGNHWRAEEVGDVELVVRAKRVDGGERELRLARSGDDVSLSVNDSGPTSRFDNTLYEDLAEGLSTMPTDLLTKVSLPTLTKQDERHLGAVEAALGRQTRLGEVLPSSLLPGT